MLRQGQMTRTHYVTQPNTRKIQNRVEDKVLVQLISSHFGVDKVMEVYLQLEYLVFLYR